MTEEGPEVAVSEDLGQIVERCSLVLANRPAGLLTDIDGTLSYIAPTPDAASVNDTAKDALRKLAGLLDIVGTISGRAAENSEGMIGIPELLYIGNHGLERRTIGSTAIHPLAALEIEAVGDLLGAVRAKTLDVPVFEGVLIENKGVTASIHYRLASDQEATHAALMALIGPEATSRGLRVTQGRMVIEIRPSVLINKGSAVATVVEEAGLKSLIFLGDDTTDIDGFKALSRLRSESVLAGVNVAVVSPESPPEVAQAADVIIHGVDSCVALLAKLAERLSEMEIQR